MLEWTGEHPYLTQRLCQALVEAIQGNDRPAVDRLCETLFCTTHAQEHDNNLLFVRNHLLSASNDADRASLLDLYARVWRRQRVSDDATNPLIGQLRLAGITRVVAGYLQVRNRVYARVFDRAWIQQNLPDAELRRQRAAFRRGVLRTSAVAMDNCYSYSGNWVGVVCSPACSIGHRAEAHRH